MAFHDVEMNKTITITITIPKRLSSELDYREIMIDLIESQIGPLNVHWSTMSTESLEKLYHFVVDAVRTKNALQGRK
ncbi:MAG: hypothetical protein DRO11_10000 [Methanobacteriota archaeon]|nr:MAG: hypothetical protein DRO11_10000 [Euryarchaeota archaeon]